MKYKLYDCPHCNFGILVYNKDLNCRIFRCGIIKNNNAQIPPHLSKELCDKLYIQGYIYGCGKPFRIDENLNIVKCDYI
jgi:DNA-directed RNA polymerase subunit RPC12/RpoP